MNGELQETQDQTELTIWARDDAFPKAPDGYGWIDRKGHQYPCKSLEEVSEKIRHDADSSVQLIWSPDSAYCQIPEQIDELLEPIREVRKSWAVEDLNKTQARLIWVSIAVAIFMAYTAFGKWMQLNQIELTNGLKLDFIEKVSWLFSSLIQSTLIGVSLLCFLIIGFIPWYQAKKYHREAHIQHADREYAVPLIRFETWLSFQSSPVTKLILITISLVFITQIISDHSILGFENSIAKAGLVKSVYKYGDYSRLLTAPLLHGGLLHFVMNALGLIYLGKRMEVFARWPHLPTVFLFSALMAGEASARLTDATSVGSSGGLMGWLGFLLVFETLHERLVPRSARRRLLGGVLLTALIGVIGYRFIDNAAHFGGLIAGMIYAGIVFPKSSSPLRPNANLTDQIVGSFCLIALFLSCGWAALKILS